MGQHYIDPVQYFLGKDDTSPIRVEVDSPQQHYDAVGTWRKPLDVSCSATVRLIDASIQAFSATFGLKGGMEQQEAMEMLESLVPPFLTQLATSIGMTTALTEQASRVKVSLPFACVYHT